MMIVKLRTEWNGWPHNSCQRMNKAAWPYWYLCEGLQCLHTGDWKILAYIPPVRNIRLFSEAFPLFTSYPDAIILQT